jgi:hypothetical protein
MLARPSAHRVTSGNVGSAPSAISARGIPDRLMAGKNPPIGQTGALGCVDRDFKHATSS